MSTHSDHSHGLIILYSSKQAGQREQTDLLLRESELIPNYLVERIDVTDPRGWMDTVRFHTGPGSCVVVTDRYRRYIVHFNRYPVSFFELREWLAKLGYRSASRAIQWQP